MGRAAAFLFSVMNTFLMGPSVAAQAQRPAGPLALVFFAPLSFSLKESGFFQYAGKARFFLFSGGQCPPFSSAGKASPPDFFFFLL